MTDVFQSLANSSFHPLWFYLLSTTVCSILVLNSFPWSLWSYFNKFLISCVQPGPCPCLKFLFSNISNQKFKSLISYTIISPTLRNRGRFALSLHPYLETLIPPNITITSWHPFLSVLPFFPLSLSSTYTNYPHSPKVSRTLLAFLLLSLRRRGNNLISATLLLLALYAQFLKCNYLNYKHKTCLLKKKQKNMKWKVRKFLRGWRHTL